MLISSRTWTSEQKMEAWLPRFIASEQKSAKSGIFPSENTSQFKFSRLPNRCVLCNESRRTKLPATWSGSSSNSFMTTSGLWKVRSYALQYFDMAKSDNLIHCVLVISDTGKSASSTARRFLVLITDISKTLQIQACEKVVWRMANLRSGSTCWADFSIWTWNESYSSLSANPTCNSSKCSFLPSSVQR